MSLDVLTGLVFLSAVLASITAALVWQQRPKAGATSMAVCVIALALWASGMGISLLGPSAWLVQLGVAAAVLASAILVSAWFTFGLRFTGTIDRVSPRTVVLLGVEPLALVALALTNDAHQLLWVAPATTVESGRAVFTYGWGPLITLHMVYGYGLVAYADVALAKKFRASRNVFRKRTFLFILFSVVLTTSSALSFVSASPLPYMTLTPVVLLVLTVVWLLLTTSNRFIQALPLDRVWAAFGNRAKSLEPVAREKAIEELATAYTVLDHRNRIVDVNPAAKRLVNLQADRIVGREITEIIPPEIFTRGDTSFLEPVTEGTYSGVWVTLPSGEEQCFDFRFTTVAGNDEDVIGRIALVNEVTERERRKETLKSRNEELERQNAQLEDFASIVSHDLRNPLNVADGHLSMLDLDGEEGERIDTARNSLDRMEEIIDDVLTIARSGQTVDETVPLDLATIAHDAWGNVDTTAATLRVDGEATIRADRARLLRLFENLFRNAIEHAGQDVTVTVGPTGSGFFVADDGPGISPDDRDTVFERGYTDAETGTGLGLAIVRTVAEAHGWEIGVSESETGGARFEVSGASMVKPTAAEPD